ncbi:MAG: hypothetical protein AB8B50_14830, partial [Pirellulaceae bacterium]
MHYISISKSVWPERSVYSPLNMRIAFFLVLLLTPMFGYADDSQADTSAKADSERVYSGLQPGEKSKPFEVLHIKDDELRKSEIVEASEDGVTLVCFIHRLSTDDRILYGLGLVDFYAARHKDLSSHFVLLSDERNKIEKMLRAWNKGGLFKHSTVSLSVDGAEGPGYYGLNREVAMTVLVIKGNKVVENLVFNAPNYRDLESIMGVVATANGKPKPKLEDVQKELRAERQRQLEQRIKASPSFKLAPNEELGKIMYGLVNSRGNRAKNAQRRRQMLTDW